MSFWHTAKWVGLVLVALVLALGLARTFSGSEDGWVRDESGQWVAHGKPGGPPPARPPARRYRVGGGARGSAG